MTPDILDNEFMVASYLKTDDDGKIEISDSKINQAIEWSKNSMRHIIVPTDDIGDLEHQWADFNTMVKKHRRESDWMSIELFGMTNQEHYQLMRMRLLHGNIDNWEDGEVDPIGSGDIPLVEGFITDDGNADYYEIGGPTYGSNDVEKAINWAEESNRVIIHPTRTLEELESLWDGYNGMIKKHRRESDWMSEELFGLTNLRHYEYLKVQFLRQDIKDDDSNPYGFVIESAPIIKKKYISSNISEASVTDISKIILEMSMPKKSIYEEKIVNNVISDVMDKYTDISYIPTMEIPYGDMPMLDPDTMIDKGVFNSNPELNYFGVLADNTKIGDTTVAEWFDDYKNFHEGLDRDSFYEHSADWLDAVRYSVHYLQQMQENGADESAIKAKKQSILELGWDPDLPFNEKTRIIAREKAIEHYSKNVGVTKVVNLCELMNGGTTDLDSKDEYKDNALKPIYIVLSEGVEFMSKAIKKLTKSKYSHASIALDTSLTHLYSYDILEGVRGGFCAANVKDYPARIGVYVCFVSKEVYKTVTESMQKFKERAKKTSYGYSNLFFNLFYIPRNREWKLVCSEFVDKFLKMCGIDITGKKSSVVSPKDVWKASEKNRYIYNVYNGQAADYKPEKAKAVVDDLITKKKAIREMNQFYLESEQTYLQGIIDNINDIPMLREMSTHVAIVETPEVRRFLEEVLFDSITVHPYCEAKRFPLEFDKEGNLLIKANKKIDYETEYAKSHKLLKQYLEVRNHEGIKYELSKLWMMLCMIEETLHSKKFNDLPSMAIESSAEVKAKAKINNDFQYYLKKVLELEPNFNFTEYYESSPFSSATTKISAPTISFTTKLIKQLIKPF